ncbi:hypothetical protein [Mesorhizobium sp. CN2-181]|uniref:hypothetical protein n=1 Tax=Mesorhizobium yinganensis TaxID=3157707 RepID=UPI0032B7C8DF
MKVFDANGVAKTAELPIGAGSGNSRDMTATALAAAASRSPERATRGDGCRREFLLSGRVLERAAGRLSG